MGPPLLLHRRIDGFTMSDTSNKTMYEKIWESHLVHHEPGQAPLLYVDRHLMHEVTSPQAFEGLKIANRGVRNTHSILATLDHCVPTKDRDKPIADPIADPVDSGTSLVAGAAKPKKRSPPRSSSSSPLDVKILCYPPGNSVPGLSRKGYYHRLPGSTLSCMDRWV